ncbi:MAG: 3-methyl-2-oxobutanoate hydroxymethyltransferase [Deltaproteobacteria bacterium]|nr:3-methyl-2-oxobutanoate hydroxymethyltransferase [Deltaproteobacteria bacterium]MBW2068710.1 3-methyl-2-oxobutanoate hydroxymethyltransferase [Deltaproteobacteria bacterium]
MNNRVTVPAIMELKGKRKITMVTAYDYVTARWVDKSNVDMILVGDSLAMVMLGHDDTLSVTMEEMLHHTRAVARGAKRALIVGDMPFMSYQVSVEQAVTNAGRFLKEAGAQAVKLEGGAAVVRQIRAIVDAGIPVQGHIGLTPQSIAQLGGFRVQGKTADAAKRLLDDAMALADAGCFSIVLEAIPAPIAEIITERVHVPTIGIGAGAGCDGQVLVIHDMVGLYDRITPRFVKKYEDLGSRMLDALNKFHDEVQRGIFPADEHSFKMKPEEEERLRSFLRNE